MGRNFRKNLIVAALGMLSALGCQHANRVPSESTVIHESVDRAPAKTDKSDLSDAQVADVQIAIARTIDSGAEDDRALNAYMAAYKRDPKRADACLRIAIELDKQAKAEEAAKWYEKALKLAPNNPEIHANVGYSHYLQHNWDLAEQHLRTAIKIKPDQKQAHNNLGFLLARRNQIDEALQHFGQSGCTTAESRANVALALAIENQFVDAVNQYKLALAADAKCPAARKGLEKLETIARKIEANERTQAQLQISPSGLQLEAQSQSQPRSPSPSQTYSQATAAQSNSTEPGSVVVNNAIAGNAMEIADDVVRHRR